MKLLEMPSWKGSDLIANDIAAVAEMVAAIKSIYAVGRFWISTSPTNPSEIIGGSWRAVGSGRVLMTAGFTYDDGEGMTSSSQTYADAGKTGGTSTHRHLTSIGSDGLRMFSLWGDGNVPIYGSEVVGDASGINVAKTSDLSHNQVRINYTKMHGNLPPFYTVWMWERVG